MATAPAPIRLVSLLVLAALAGGGAWLAFRASDPSKDPAAVWDYIRDRVLEGDGGAAWRLLLPQARPKFVEFVRQNAEAPESDARAAEWRRKTGLSRQDLRTLPPEEIMSREYLANADRIRGSRVFRTEQWPEDRAFLHISLKDGGDIHFVLRRVDGAWKIEDLIPMVTEKGWIPSAGAQPIPVRK
jgi:hypothetical protein